MDVLNIPNDYAGFVDSTQKVHLIKKNTKQIIVEEEDITKTYLKLLLLSIPGGVILLCVIGVKM